MRRPVALLLVLPFAACDCGNECGFSEQCEGNVLQVCGDGPDQMFGRDVHEYPCLAPATACVEVDESSAACVIDPPTACDPEDAAPRCEGTVLVTCVGSRERAYLTATDCADQDGAGRCGGRPDDGSVIGCF